MDIDKWKKILLSIVLVYSAVAVGVLIDKDVCGFIFFNSFCRLDSRFLYVVGPVILIAVLVWLWGKELVAQSKNVKVIVIIILLIFCVFILGRSLQTTFFPDKCNEVTAKEFIFDKLEKERGKNWDSNLGMGRNEFFKESFIDIYDTGRRTYQGYKICHVKNNVFFGAKDFYYYYDSNKKKYIEY